MFKKVEIVIVSDGSKDKTSQIIQVYTNDYTLDQDIIVRGIKLI